MSHSRHVTSSYETFLILKGGKIDGKYASLVIEQLPGKLDTADTVWNKKSILICHSLYTVG